MCATVQKRKATEHVFSRLKKTLSVFYLAALLLWSLNLSGPLQSGSRNQSAVVFMTFNYACNNHVPMKTFYFVAEWCLPLWCVCVCVFFLLSLYMCAGIK